MFKNRLAVNFFFLINGFIYANWVSRLPKLQEVYQMDNSQTGLALLAIAIGALIAMPFTGWLIVNNGSRKTTIISGFLFCLLVPLAALMGTWTFLIVLFFIMGISIGVMDVSMNAQAVLVEQNYQRPIMSSFHAVFSGGMMLGAGAGALFTKWDISLFTHLLIIAIASLFFVGWASFNLIQDQGQTKEEEGSAFQLPSKALWGIGIIAFCCMMGEGAMADWSTNYMKNIALSDDALAPLGLGAFSTAMMLGRIFGDKGRSIFGDEKLLIINSVVATIGAFLFIIFPQPLMVIAGMFLVGLGLSVIVPIAYSTAGATEGLAPGVGISMVTTIGYAGFLFGPPIIGYLADWKTLQVAMLLIAVLFLIMTLLTIINSRSKTTS